MNPSMDWLPRNRFLLLVVLFVMAILFAVIAPLSWLASKVGL